MTTRHSSGFRFRPIGNEPLRLKITSGSDESQLWDVPKAFLALLAIFTMVTSFSTREAIRAEDAFSKLLVCL